MKKALIASILGVVVSAGVSYGQGVIQFNNYVSHSYNPVIYQGGQNVNTANVQLDLYYALGTYSNISSFLAVAALVGSTTIDTSLNAAGAYGGTGPGGYYGDPNTINLAGWTTADTATFLVRGWDTTSGSSYLTAGISGQTTLWTEVVDSAYPGSLSGYGIVPSSVGNPEPMYNGMPTLTLVPVPEPGTLALAGLGGLGMLMTFRRKKA